MKRRSDDTLDLFERAARDAGRVCGIDEAGRGPLAGPVVAAAVILDPARRIVGLADSKVLAPQRREQLADRIRELAIAWAVAEASVAEIDALNILQATLLAMRRAVAQLPVTPAYALIDGNQLPRIDIPGRAIVAGDATEACISAASILAKTARDALMQQIEARHPGYGFARHMGYGTPQHLAALRRLGPCSEHRSSFAPVRARLAECRAHTELATAAAAAGPVLTASADMAPR